MPVFWIPVSLISTVVLTPAWADPNPIADTAAAVSRNGDARRAPRPRIVLAVAEPPYRSAFAASGRFVSISTGSAPLLEHQTTRRAQPARRHLPHRHCPTRIRREKRATADSSISRARVWRGRRDSICAPAGRGRPGCRPCPSAPGRPSASGPRPGTETPRRTDSRRRRSRCASGYRQAVRRRWPGPAACAAHPAAAPAVPGAPPHWPSSMRRLQQPDARPSERLGAVQKLDHLQLTRRLHVVAVERDHPSQIRRRGR